MSFVKFPPQCPHICKNLITIYEVKRLQKQSDCCSKCDYAGPNLWICLQRDCLNVGCSEQIKDHSTEHFHQNNVHCLQMNLSSQRAWCYLCEREVFLDNKNHSSMLPTTDQSGDSDEFMTSSGLVGLQNIANTCYMNSALQALSNLQPMTCYFLNCSDLIEHTLELNAHRNKAGLAKSYHRLMRDIWCRHNSEKDYIAPRGVLYGIRSVHPMFRGFQQHDTQEFLRCFMDQLHEELKEQRPTSPISSRLRTSTSDSHKIEDVAKTRHSSSGTPCDSASSSSSSLSETEYETCDSNESENSTISISQMFSKCFVGRNVKSTTADNNVQSDRSIISDIFDGKLLSSVQCLTCDRISTREETFQDLSLPIPNRDYLNMLHQTHSVATLNLADVSPALLNDSWFFWIWNMFRSWLWGPSVNLYDCMASFFSADELKGDNMYSCEKCNKLRTGVKYSQILDLPEVLCIHLKRFRHDLSYSSKISSHVTFPLDGFDMRTYLHKECASNISLYNLSSVICHHGTVGGGHYTCYARNINNCWYEFDDTNVTEVSADVVQNCQAYVLFYKKYNPQMDLIRDEANNISSSNPVNFSDIRFFVSRDWLLRFNTFAEPGPINNWAMLCPHGGVLQSKISLLNEIAVPISQPLWEFLYHKFGGGPAINMLFECQICKRASETLARRQLYELTIFTKYNGMDAEVENNAIFAISMPWLRKWQQFARGLSEKEPGPITNASIALPVDNAQASSPTRTLKPGSDYAQINAPLWRFLHGIYGGGPQILIRDSFDEIETIVQCDENEDEKNSEENRDLSDTESNIGQNKIAYDSELGDNSEVLGIQVHEINGNSPAPSTTAIDSRHSKHHKTEEKVLKPLTIRSKRRNRKGHRPLGANFFGPKGKYIIQKNTMGSDTVPIHTFESFHCDRNQSNQITNSIPENVTATTTSSECNVCANHVPRKVFGRDKVMLKKYMQFQESGESTETDI